MVGNYQLIIRKQNFGNGIGVKNNSDGTVNNVSVNSNNSLSVEELSQGIPNNKIGYANVGDIRRLGGNVILDPTKNNPAHSLLSGITAKQADEVFNNIIDNPYKNGGNRCWIKKRNKESIFKSGRRTVDCIC